MALERAGGERDERERERKEREREREEEREERAEREVARHNARPCIDFITPQLYIQGFLAHKKTPTPEDPPRTPGIGLQEGPRGCIFL